MSRKAGGAYYDDDDFDDYDEDDEYDEYDDTVTGKSKVTTRQARLGQGTTGTSAGHIACINASV
jgi:hypothetical protein